MKINIDAWKRFNGEEYFKHCLTSDKSEDFKQFEMELDLSLLWQHRNSVECEFIHRFTGEDTQERRVYFNILIDESGVITYKIDYASKSQRDRLYEIIQRESMEYLFKFITALYKRGLIDWETPCVTDYS